MIDAVRYVVDNGIKWRAMPADFPPWPRVYAFFARWRDTGLVSELHERMHQADRDLGVFDPPGGAGVLALDTDGVSALLQVASLVDHEDCLAVVQLLH
jgi:hypothetical protein